MRDVVRAAAACVDSRPAETSDNLDKIDRLCRQAAAQNADVILFPELSLSGFVPNHPLGDHQAWLRTALRRVAELAEPLQGAAVTGLIEISRRHDLFVSAGLIEDGGNLRFNTQVLVGPDGIVGRWRKMHIPMFETPFFDGGDGPCVVQTELGRVGVNICFDALMPESTRLLAVGNVDFVLFPFAADPPPCTPQAWADWAVPAIRSRCVENGVFGVACNYVGRVSFAGVEQQFPGGGIVLGPRGESLAAWDREAHEPGLMMAELPREALRLPARNRSTSSAAGDPICTDPWRRDGADGSAASVFPVESGD